MGVPSDAVEVALAELPGHHPGGIVLERCFARHRETRDRAAVEAEYTSDKYAAALAFVEKEGVTDPFAVRLDEFGRDADADWCYSEGNELFRAPLASLQRRFDSFLEQRLAGLAQNCRSVIEPGCGYGYNLWLLARSDEKREYLGGDIATTAVRLAERLYKKSGRPRVCRFDYYADTYDLLEAAEPPVLVFTCHSIEQLPSAGHFLDVLSRSAGKISQVVHLEPIYESHDDSLIGRLRRAYADSVDYNRDLLGQLGRRANVQIQAVEANVIGLNPLNPTSVVHWSFA